MAKAKAKAKAKATAKVNKVPEGYKVLERQPTWDFEKHPVIEGVREKTFTKTTKYGKQRYCIVNDATLGKTTVWESGMLSDFFDQTEPGNQVRIEFLGFGTAKKGQHAPKLFSVAVKE